MKRMLITVAILLSFVNATCFAQQSDFSSALQEKLKLYYQRHVPAKIHLTFNEPTYAPGDTALYKIFFFTADNFVRVSGRQIMTVQLVSPNGVIAHQAKVLVTDGAGFNQIPIAVDASPGKYAVIAFNDVMKEYDQSLFFQSSFWVTGPKLILEPDVREDLAFYPEGGHFISGITNKLVVTGPPSTSWKVLSGNNEIISFEIDEKGLGLFFLKPDAGARYVAISESMKAELPESEEDGIGLLAHVPAGKMPIRVTVQTPESSSLKSEHFILAMTQHGIVYYTAAVSFSDKTFLTFSMAQDKLPEGIARITLFKEDGTVMAERLVYVQGDPEPNVRINLDRKDFSVREQIPVKILINSTVRTGIASNLAVSVFRDDIKRDGATTRNIVDNAVLYGDLSGSLNGDVDLPANDPDQHSHLDHYMVTQKWRRFSWEDVLTEKLPDSPYRKFLNLEGRAVTRSGDPLPDAIHITFFLQKSVMTYVVDVDRSGKFGFSLLMDFYGEEEIFYRAEQNGKFLPDIKVMLNRDVLFPIPVRRLVESSDADDLYAFAIKRNLIRQSYSYHSTSRIYGEPPSLNSLIEEEIDGADVTVNLDDYYLFPTMVETLREIVPMLQHRRQQSRDVVRLYFEDRDRLAGDEPLFIIDGVITDNTTYFLNLNPADIFSIKVVHSLKKLQAFGSIGKNGIVLVETKLPGNAAVVPRSDYTFSATGLQLASPRHSRQTVGHNTRVPDLRTNLYWDPKIKTNASGEVNILVPASDVTGTYRIIVEGFAQNGEPVFKEESFEIQFPE